MGLSCARFWYSLYLLIVVLGCSRDSESNRSEVKDSAPGVLIKESLKSPGLSATTDAEVRLEILLKDPRFLAWRDRWVGSRIRFESIVKKAQLEHVKCGGLQRWFRKNAEGDAGRDEWGKPFRAECGSNGVRFCYWSNEFTLDDKDPVEPKEDCVDLKKFGVIGDPGQEVRQIGLGF